MIGYLKPLQKSKLKKRQFSYNNTILESSDLLKTQSKLIEDQSDHFSMLFNKLEALCDSFSQFSQHSNDKQDRDYPVRVQIPHLPNNQNDRKTQIQKWLTLLCGEVFSISFKLFETKKLTEKESKIYCSQNILKHILLLTKKNTLNKGDFELINKSLKKTISYYLLKYPQSMGTEINKKLLKEILSTNVLDSNTNNILFQSGIQFTYREDGIYNDFIMNFVNHLLDLINSKDDDGKSRFHRFEEMFEKIFTSPQEKAWVENFNPSSFERQKLSRQVQNFKKKLIEHRRNIEKSEQQQKKAQDYENKVRGYSKYVIGRKISQNTPDYSQQQIEAGNITMKTTAVLRILTKWCQELEKKYFDEDYFMNKDEDIIQQKGGMTSYSTQLKERISQLIEEEKQRIDKYLESIQQNNFQNQNKNNYSQLAKGGNHHIAEDEKAMGKFVSKTVMSLQTYIISYLNRLIHGILKVAQEVYDKDLKNKNNWPSPPELLTFFIGDLIRCKYSSKEKEVIRIYKELQTMSHLHPEKFKIVRIKNRLNLGTRDILINAKFQDKILCEIQLAINTETNPFLYCSDKFNHYLYELKRAPLGPVSEMCSIWASNDQRRKAFEEIINSQRNKKDEEHGCLQQQFDVQNLPFECSECGRTRYTKKYIIDDLKCISCNDYWVCGRCSISKLSQKELLERIKMGSSKSRSKIKKKVMEGDLPVYGIFINIQSRQIKENIFKTITINKKVYLFNQNEDKLYLYTKFKRGSSKINDFYNQNLVFETQPVPQLVSINETEIIKGIIVKNYLSSVYKEKREAIHLERYNLSEEDILNVDGQETSLHIHSITLGQNKLQKISGITERFPNLKRLTLNHNQIRNIEGIGNLKKLERIRLMKNELTEIPQQIRHCTKLKKIRLQQNKIKSIPSSIQHLNQLEQFYLGTNELSHLPQEICQLKNLLYLNVPQNVLETIPEDIGKLQKLYRFIFTSNRLTSVPQSLTELQNLVLLNLAQNKISNFPEGIEKMKSLRRVLLSENKLTQFPKNIFLAPEIRIINVSNNEIKQIPSQLSNKSQLQVLLANENNIQSVPSTIYKLRNLRLLGLSKNRIDTLPIQFGKLKSLQHLDVSFNKLTQFPQNFEKLEELKILICQNNQIKTLNKKFFHLPQLQVLHIMHNQLEELGSGIENLKKLKKLHFEGNKVNKIHQSFKELRNLADLGFGTQQTQIPEIVFQLQNLQELEIHGCQLKKIPEQIFNLTKLTNLTIQNSTIQQIPDSITKLKRLKILRLQKNRLKTVSGKIEELSKLIELHIQENNLTVLPKQLYNLHNLRIINISNNGFTVFPKQFENLSNVRNGFFTFDNNPIKQVQCDQYLLEKANQESKQFLQNWLSK